MDERYEVPDRSATVVANRCGNIRKGRGALFQGNAQRAKPVVPPQHLVEETRLVTLGRYLGRVQDPARNPPPASRSGEAGNARPPGCLPGQA